VLAAQNGVLGDHLAATDNPLATTMALRREGRPLVIERGALQLALPDGGGRLLDPFEEGGLGHACRLSRSSVCTWWVIWACD